MFAVVRFHNEFQRSLDLKLVGTFLNAAVHQGLWSLIVNDSFYLEQAFQTKLNLPRGGHPATVTVLIYSMASRFQGFSLLFLNGTIHLFIHQSMNFLIL